MRTKTAIKHELAARIFRCHCQTRNKHFVIIINYFCVRAAKYSEKNSRHKSRLYPMCKRSTLSQLIICRLLNVKMLVIQMIVLTEHLIFFMVDICCLPLMRFSFYVFNDLCVNMAFLESVFHMKRKYTRPKQKQHTIRINSDDEHNFMKFMTN